METPNFSIEFFPPKTAEGAEKLRVTRQKLAELHPKYFSVTFGAGGSTQAGTLQTVLEIRQEGHEAAPHLSCIGGDRESRTATTERPQQGLHRDRCEGGAVGIDREATLREHGATRRQLRW